MGLIRNLYHEWHNGWREFTKDAFRDQTRLVSDVRTIFDIGANVGQTTARYKGAFPGATVYSFEPFSGAFQKLSHRFEGNDSIKPIQCAVSSEVGVERFCINRDVATSSLLPTAKDAGCWVDPPEAIELSETIEVPVTTIDGFCRQEAIDEIQILKLDIQGGELNALKGATGKLSQAAISLVYTELLFVSIYQGAALFGELCSFLLGYEYTLFDIYDLTHTGNGHLKWCCAIFVSPKIILK